MLILQIIKYRKNVNVNKNNSKTFKNLLANREVFYVIMNKEGFN